MTEEHSREKNPKQIRDEVQVQGCLQQYPADRNPAELQEWLKKSDSNFSVFLV